LQAWTDGSFFLFGAFYLLTSGYVFTRQNARNRDFRLLLAFLLAMAIANLFSIGWPTSFLYGLIAAEVVLLHQYRSSLLVASRSSKVFWWVVGAIWLTAYGVSTVVMPTNAVWVFAGGLALFTGATALFVIRVVRKTLLSFSQRQMLYWGSALLLVGGGQVLGLLGHLIWSNILLSAGTLLLVYLVTASHVMDFLSLARHMVITLILVLLTGGIYGIVWFGVSAVPAMQSSVADWLPGLGLLVLFVIFIRPLWKISESLAQQILPGTDFDTNRIIREYSLSISNILDPQRLATVAVGLISEAIEVQRGILLLIFREQMGEINGYRMKGNTGMGIPAPEDGMLSANSPIAAHFIQAHEPLTQYALDFNPEFANLPPKERLWFANLDVDIYVPIYAKDDWIGLLALGAKASGQPYQGEDLLLLRILADQTAVALQNARLVDSLMRVNNDFRRAYSAMDQSNRQLARANTQLEKLDRAKSDFIAIASHELRTPLTVMRGYTEMLQDDPTIKENGYYQKLVSGIHGGIMRFHEIVDGMLDIAMIDNSTLNLSVNEVSLDVLLRIICNSLRDAIAERRIALTLESLQGLPAIQGDPEALRKVFHHLVVNAVKYTPDGGSVSIHGHRLAAGEHNLIGEGIEIVISDTGIGIDPEFHDLIFVKFYQTGEIALHSSGKTKFKGGGPGLGLTIAKGIVEAHGGRIWVESPGHDEERCPGSKFHVVLPVRIKSS
jgi:signal transduction histidine kinase